MYSHNAKSLIHSHAVHTTHKIKNEFIPCDYDNFKIHLNACIQSIRVSECSNIVYSEQIGTCNTLLKR